MAVRLRGLFVLFVRSRGIVEQQAIDILDMNRYMHIQDIVRSKCMKFVIQEIARAKLRSGHCLSLDRLLGHHTSWQ